MRKWQLACEGNIAHVVVMPNVSIQKLQDFVEEMVTVRQEVREARGWVGPRFSPSQPGSLTTGSPARPRRASSVASARWSMLHRTCRARRRG